MVDPQHPAAAPAPHFSVIMRACDKVTAVHGDSRPFGLTKLQTIKTCVHSMIRAMEGHSHSILVIGDSLSDAAVAFFEALPGVTLRREQLLSPEKTLDLQIELGLKEPDETWVYLCEDDYLHRRDSFSRIRSLIDGQHEILDTVGARRNWLPRLGGNVAYRPLFIHPSDYPDRYLRRDRRPSYLFAAPDGHWRQTSHTTHTLMATGRTLRRFQTELRASVKGPNDKVLSHRTYGGVFERTKALCVSPLPGFACHFTDGVMSPFVDWAAEVERNRTELIAAGLW